MPSSATSVTCSAFTFVTLFACNLVLHALFATCLLVSCLVPLPEARILFATLLLRTFAFWWLKLDLAITFAITFGLFTLVVHYFGFAFALLSFFNSVHIHGNGFMRRLRRKAHRIRPFQCSFVIPHNVLTQVCIWSPILNLQSKPCFQLTRDTTEDNSKTKFFL